MQTATPKKNSRPPAPRAVLFDLDGTLVDTAPDLIAPVQQFRAEIGLPALADETLRPLASRGALALLRTGLPDVSDEALEGYRLEFLRRYAARIAEHSQPYSGMTALLDLLRDHKVPIGVVTNKPEALARALLDALGIVVDVLVGGDSVARPKPDPLPVLTAVERLGLAPAQCWMVGDDPRDLIAARAAGCVSVAVLHGYGLTPEVLEPDAADLVFADLEALSQRLQHQLSQRQRPLRSFVLRQGRFTVAQRRALEDQLTRFAAPMPLKAEDQRAWTGIVLEIGFGNGEALLQCAAAQPTALFIGAEVHGPGVGHLLMHVAAQGLHNVRVWHDDALTYLDAAVDDGSLDEVRVWFPDPWHKSRHQKRRLVNAAFCARIAQKLRIGGVLHLATDWQDYAEQMLDVGRNCPALRNLAPVDYAPRPQSRPLTHFEQRGLRLGHAVYDLLFTRRQD